MPAKKATPVEKPVTADPAVPSGKKTAPAKANVSNSTKPVKPGKVAAKPPVKKAAPAKKKPAAPVESVKAAVPPTGPDLVLTAAGAPAKDDLTLPAEPAAPTVPAAGPVAELPAPAQPEPVPSIPAPVAPVPSAPIKPALPTGLEKPSLVQTIAVMTMINGILNILWGLAASCGLTAGIVTVCLVPFALLEVLLGIFELNYASKLMSTFPQRVQPSQAIAALEICCILFGNVISLIVGILALVFYSDANVKAYFARLNAQA